MAIQTLRKKARGAKYSRLVWLGLAVTVLGFLEAQFRTIEHLLPEKYRGLGLMLLGLAVVVLRFMTTVPVEDLAPEHDDPHPEDAPAAPPADNDPP